MKNPLTPTTAALITAALIAVPSIAQSVDGTLAGDESFYGSALSVQNTNTQFGNAGNGDVAQANGGSEINQVFGTVSNGMLYVLITGNLESNFNKLDIFIDVNGSTTGFNTINAATMPFLVDPFASGGFDAPRGANESDDGAFLGMDGMTFDEGFFADHYLSFANGNESTGFVSTDFWAFTSHYANLTGGASGALGMQLSGQGNPNAQRNAGDLLSDTPTLPSAVGSQAGLALPGLGQGELIDRDYAFASGGATDDTGAGLIASELEFALDVNPAEQGLGFGLDNLSNHRDMSNIIDLLMAIDNSNTAGVSGDGGLNNYADPTTEDVTSVITGVEFAIPLSALGNPTGDINIVAFINGSGNHDFLSNQFAGEGILQANLGNPGAVDLSAIAGNQFVTISQAGELIDGDLNGDGFVGAADLDILLANWGDTVTQGSLADGDANNDGVVNNLDLAVVQSNFGNGTLPGGTVPEPSSLILLGLGGLALIRRRRRI